jgi:exo-1,4-beta-D-glucosaminidase
LLGDSTIGKNWVAIVVITVLLFASLSMLRGTHNKVSSNEDSAMQSHDLVENRLLLNEDWAIQSSNLVNATGDILSTKAFNPIGWFPTSVPSTVLAALVGNGVYPDPYFGMNLQSIPDLTGSPWWYRTEFVLPQEYNNKSIWLHFNGINYKANIWLNGEKIADNTTVQGMFRLYEFNITSYITFAENNSLAVEVFAPTDHDLWDSWVDWNPTPPDRDMGIWQDVYVDTSGPVVMKHPYVCTDLDLPSLNVAHLNISAEITNMENTAVNGVLTGKIENVTNLAEGGTSEGQSGTIMFSREVSLGPRENKTLLLSPSDITQLNIFNPRPWWPNLVGSQNLYDLTLQLEIAGEVSDTETVCFGIREVSSYLSDQGYRIFTVNGKNILVRGGGWCPDMMFRSLPEKEDAEMRYARDMNLNAIRFEGKLGTDGLWDICDKYGIMVMAGWCCCSHWEEWSSWDATDFTVAMESQKDQIIRLRNHPSFLVWLYGSDNPPPPDIENAYLNILTTYAPTLPHMSSATEASTVAAGPTGVKMRGPYSYEPPVYYYLEQSPGGAWSLGTEMGPGENVPPIESMREMLPEGHLWPIDEFWNYHCGSNQPFSNLNIYTVSLNSRYGTATGVEDYCEKAQLMNYESIRAELEAFGRNKYNSTGVITWQYNSAWPRLIWQSYDYSLRPGGSYFGAKEACEPLHVQYSYDDNSIYVVNSYYKGFKNLEVDAKVFNLEMTEEFSYITTMNVGPDSKNYAFTIPPQENSTTIHFLNLELKDSSENSISSNFYWLSTKQDALDFNGTTWYYTPQSAFADFTDLKELPTAQVNLTYFIEVKGDHLITHIAMQNPTDNLAFFIHLRATYGPNGTEVLPILWSANYFSLLPGESREVTATFATKNLNGAMPVVEVAGWNVPPVVFNYETPEVLVHKITVGSETFGVVTESNSTVGNLTLDWRYEANDLRGKIYFDIAGYGGASGFCNITIPKNLMTGEPAWSVLVDNVNAVYGFSDNITHTCLYIEYSQGTHDVQIFGTWVVPEFPMFMIQILFIVAAIVAVISKKKAKKA